MGGCRTDAPRGVPFRWWGGRWVVVEWWTAASQRRLISMDSMVESTTLVFSGSSPTPKTIHCHSSFLQPELFIFPQKRPHTFYHAGPAVRNQSFDFAPVVAAFLADPDCKRILRHHHMIGRSLQWFQKVFALMVGRLTASELRACIVVDSGGGGGGGGGGLAPAGSSGSSDDSARGSACGTTTKKKQGPLNAAALQAAVKMMSQDPLLLLLDDLSTPELAMLIAAQHVSQGTEMVGSAGAGEWWWVHGFMD
jgi:hypothetical protein